MSVDVNLTDSRHPAGPINHPIRLCWIGFVTFILRSTQDIFRYFILTIAPPAIMTALYCAIFGSIVGSRVGDVGGFAYVHYIAPGLILMPVITDAYRQAAFSLLTAKFHKTIDEHLISPLPSWMIVVSYVAGGVIRGALVGVFVGAIALLLTHIHISHVVWVVGALLLASLVASLAGFISGVFAQTFDQLNWVPILVLTPLTYTSGVFYSLSLLPGWAQQLSLLNPVFYLVSLFRYAVLGVSDVEVGLSVSVIVLAAGGMFVIAAALMKRGVGIKP
jgi:ABC-2 type transport system permease protein